MNRKEKRGMFRKVEEREEIMEKFLTGLTNRL